jgi:hypothetical protein
MSPHPSAQGTKPRRYASHDASRARVERATIAQAIAEDSYPV